MKKFFLLFIGILALDVGTKSLVRHFMTLGAEIPLAPFFSLVHVTNTGVAFGLLQGNNFILAVVGIFFTTILVGYARRVRQSDPFLTAVLGVVTGGAWGNLLDRIRYGQVTDFLDFYVRSAHWPAFNVADSAICIGAALLLWDNFKHKESH